MASYQIEWKQSAKKELKKLPKSIIPKIIDVVATLADDPYPKGSKNNYTYRIRISDYRVVYSVFCDLFSHRSH